MGQQPTLGWEKRLSARTFDVMQSWMTSLDAYWRLTRPGVLAGVLGAMGVAALVAGPEMPGWARLFNALSGAGLLMAGAVAMNQRLEREADATMARTAGRPLPASQLAPAAVTRFAVLVSLGGLAWLAAATDWTVTLTAAVSWVGYVLVYTPLKRRTAWQTPVGAIAGALPMLLGAAVAGALFTPRAAWLFGVVFFWQFPHTMAIGWRYRQEYTAGRILVAAVADPSGRLAGRLAVFGTAGLLGLSVVPWAMSVMTWPLGAAVVGLALMHLGFSIAFARRPNDATARALGRVAMAHLPLLLALSLIAVHG
ncbi:MAG: protoheme IX farnesyltransferase [Pirellulales bacterium]|nr:protoheme IX farnesyltransferase [Pirellulales bacterium]